MTEPLTDAELAAIRKMHEYLIKGNYWAAEDLIKYGARFLATIDARDKQIETLRDDKQRQQEYINELINKMGELGNRKRAHDEQIEALEWLVGRLREDAEYLVQDVGPCVSDAGAACASHRWAGVARCSARDLKVTCAFTVADYPGGET